MKSSNGGIRLAWCWEVTRSVSSSRFAVWKGPEIGCQAQLEALPDQALPHLQPGTYEFKFLINGEALPVGGFWHHRLSSKTPFGCRKHRRLACE